MKSLDIHPALSRLSDLDRSLCLTCNRITRERTVQLFAAVSRLGDGAFWYALMAYLPIYQGPQALGVVLRMLLVGLLCLGLYRLIKRKTARPRPYMVESGVHLRTTAMDQWAFPSGHTMHAVAFTIVATAFYPDLAWVLVPFTGLVAASRVVLGLHYPSDVLAGGLLGGVVALLALQL